MHEKELRHVNTSNRNCAKAEQSSSTLHDLSILACYVAALFHLAEVPAVAEPVVSTINDAVTELRTAGVAIKWNERRNGWDVTGLAPYNTLFGDGQLKAYREEATSNARRFGGTLKKVGAISELQLAAAFFLDDTDIREIFRSVDASRLGILSVAGNGITDKSATIFSGIENLHILEMSETAATHILVKEVLSLKHLGDLRLRRMKLGASVLPDIIRRRNVRKVVLDYTDVGDADFASAFSDSVLSHVSLRGTKVSDKSAKAIGSLGEVVELDISETSLSDMCVLEIARLKKLRLLVVRGSGITSSGKKVLRGLLPECRLVEEE